MRNKAIVVSFCAVLVACGVYFVGRQPAPSALASLDHEAQTVFPVYASTSGMDSASGTGGRVLRTIYRTGTAVCVAPHIIATSGYLLPEEMGATGNQRTLVVDYNNLIIGQPSKKFTVEDADRFGPLALVRIRETCAPAALQTAPVSLRQELLMTSVEFRTRARKTFLPLADLRRSETVVTRVVDPADDLLYGDVPAHERASEFRVMSVPYEGHFGTALWDRSGRLVGLKHYMYGDSTCAAIPAAAIESAVRAFSTGN